MPSQILLPDGSRRQTNLHLPATAVARMRDDDVLDMTRRVREIDRRLYVGDVHDVGGKFIYIIMEHCDDGVDRLVFRVKRENFDARLLDRLRYLMARPLDVRMAELEAEEYRWDEERKQDELDELYERVGRPMWTELERCGFTERPVSYPKLGVAAPGRAR